jgi:hypothetical protein
LDIGREFGGDARESHQRRSENKDSNCSWGDAYDQLWHLEILKAAGYLPASIEDASLFNTMSYNIGSGGGGICTRSLVYVKVCPKCGYDTTLSGWPEHGREDEALHELVANWHCLTPSVMAAIMDLLRCG